MAIDLSKIRPVDISSAAVVGGADPYNAVSPAAMDGDGAIPVARAEAVVPGVAAPSEATASADPAQPALSEVRAAEPVGVKESIETDFPGIALPEPPPIRF
jgi:hypothetical protein